MLAFLMGKKTYVVAAGMVLYALGGFLTGNMDANKAMELLLEGLGLSALRAGVAKS